MMGAFAEMSEDVSRICGIIAYDLAQTHVSYYQHRGALRGTPGSVCPQPEPNATELPSSPPISAQTSQRQGVGGGGVARRARAAQAPKPKSCATSCGTSFTTPCAASFTCHSKGRPGVGRRWQMTVDKIIINTFTIWQMTMGKINTFTMNNFTFPSFAASNTSSATSCFKLFSCVLHVSSKGRRGGTRVLPGPSLRCSKSPARPPPHSNASEAPFRQPRAWAIGSPRTHVVHVGVVSRDGVQRLLSLRPAAVVCGPADVAALG